jgi:glyoxylase-like metal-dependent hydrolase (beta-lactamase superfamily II)
MLYSHEHGDHESGGQIFKDAGARVIAQENCTQALNKNPRAVPPDETFKTRRDITLGGTTIELYHFGPSHGKCLTIMRLAKERLAYTVDILTPHSVLYRDIRGDYRGMIATLKKIRKMDVDRIVPGHGIPVAPKSVAGDMLRYLADLEAEVGKAMRENASADAVKNRVNLRKYEKWRNADRFLMQNVEGMMRIIKAGK